MTHCAFVVCVKESLDAVGIFVEEICFSFLGKFGTSIACITAHTMLL